MRIRLEAIKLIVLATAICAALSVAQPTAGCIGTSDPATCESDAGGQIIPGNPVL